MASAGPVIPPPPPRVGPRRRRSSVRLLVWPVAFVLGVGLGVAVYQWVPGASFYFDYWLALFG
jgi:hypothetical protein